MRGKNQINKFFNELNNYFLFFAGKLSFFLHKKKSRKGNVQNAQDHKPAKKKMWM